MYRGVFTALVTPFTEDKKIDEKALRNLVEKQIIAGVAGLVPVGTTGESPTLTQNETEFVIKTVIDQVQGRVPIIAGAGDNSTESAIQKTKLVKQLGANASLQVVPYYNKPTQAGLIKHFTAIADTVDFPIILYDVPGRTGAALENASVIELSKHENIKGVKVACGNIPQIMDLIAQIPPNFDILSGDDNLVFPIMMLGGHGVISVASNIFPSSMVKLVEACEEQNLATARDMHYQLLPIFKMIFLESNPIPIKAALAIKGIIKEIYRLPLCQISSVHRKQVSEILSSAEKNHILS